MKYQNTIEFKVWGRYALFTDPLTRIGGEKFSYQIPTYEALKGILSSIYWKPTIIWFIDKVRIMKPIKTQSRGIKTLNFSGIYPIARDVSKKKEEAFNDLAFYTYLVDVEYQVQAHFDWNYKRHDLEQDRNEHKHYCIAKRMIERGGRRDIFLGTRECQGYVEPCQFGEGDSFYDHYEGEMSFGLMFHGFDYPDEYESGKFYARFWHAKMTRGIIDFLQPNDKSIIRKFVRPMQADFPNTIGLQERGLLEDCDEGRI